MTKLWRLTLPCRPDSFDPRVLFESRKFAKWSLLQKILIRVDPIENLRCKRMLYGFKFRERFRVRPAKVFAKPLP